MRIVRGIFHRLDYNGRDIPYLTNPTHQEMMGFINKVKARPGWDERLRAILVDGGTILYAFDPGIIHVDFAREIGAEEFIPLYISESTVGIARSLFKSEYGFTPTPELKKLVKNAKAIRALYHNKPFSVEHFNDKNVKNDYI